MGLQCGSSQNSPSNPEMYGFREKASIVAMWLVPVVTMALLSPTVLRSCSFCRAVAPGTWIARDRQEAGARAMVGKPCQQGERPGRTYKDCPCKWGNPAVQMQRSDSEAGKPSVMHLLQPRLADCSNDGSSRGPRRYALNAHGILAGAASEPCILLCRFHL